MKLLMSVAGAAIALLLSTPLLAQNVDSDGCYDARGCLSVSSEWGRNDRLNIRVHNNCSEGVYVRMCGLQQDGRSGGQCMAHWIRGHGSWGTYVSNAHSSGRHAWQYVGSQRSGGAWLCASKVSGWGDDLF